MLKRIISCVLIFAMLSVLSLVAFAAKGFADVDEESYSWAIEQINDMADKKIISGYPDGTFQPAKGITKIEAMLLISRILGKNDDTYADSLKDIYKIYEEKLEDLDIQYGEEIAFLIYKGVFALGEIEELAEENELNEPLLRHEAAMYLTKVMDADADLSDADTGFEDEDEIPEASRAYVKYVKEEGIMQGMTATTFNPDVQVNRAQMAVMLYRVMEAKELLFIEGELDRIIGSEITVSLTAGSGSYDISEAEFYMNGEACEASDLKSGFDVTLVFEDATLKRVETIYFAPEVVKTIVGQITEIVLTSIKTVKIENSGTNKTEIYSVDPGCEVYVNNGMATLSVLRTKDNARLHLDKNNVVTKIDVIDTNVEFSDGIINKLDYDEHKVEILRKDGTVETYYVSDDIIVTRNKKNSNLSNLLAGDKVSKCIVRYNKIDSLQVTSDIGSTTGTITEILIAKEASIVITKNGEDTRYPMTKGIKVFLDDEECEVYDLRLDMSAEITTDSGAVSEIRVTSAQEIAQISGIVEVVNPSYGFINVKTTTGQSQQVFVSDSTKITADGAITGTKTIKNIREGDYVFVIGKMVNGAFQATTIVIVDNN
ncbi:MAG: S-layer homology domain-containing protein [Ruminococcaceae bacterium]|nr:S-layer homology domain-containing protein [Oscillospiraceae bacterium]